MPNPAGRVAVTIDTEAREELRRLAYTLTGAAARRVELGEALRAACSVARAHPDETLAALTANQS
jgi:hypothetical protein